jgi:hypothetical protein
LRTIRAFVSDDFTFAAGGVELQVGLQELNDQGIPVRTDAVLTMQDAQGNPVDVSWRWHYISEEERNMLLPKSSLRLEEGVGQAILEALARHYHGTSDTHRMANDLGRERQRRDQAEDRLWEVLSQLATHEQVESGRTGEILFQAVQAQSLLAQASGQPTEMGTAVSRLTDYLPELLMRVSRLQPSPASPQENLLFHTGIDNHCRGHMPWDFGEGCSSQ